LKVLQRLFPCQRHQVIQNTGVDRADHCAALIATEVVSEYAVKLPADSGNQWRSGASDVNSDAFMTSVELLDCRSLASGSVIDVETKSRYYTTRVVRLRVDQPKPAPNPSSTIH
jgi:hypothetical protein